MPYAVGISHKSERGFFMSIVNIMELFVEQKMEEILPTAECCTCDKCLDDIRAMSLNKLPPRYVSTDKGKLFSKLNSLQEQQNGVDINVAVLSAIEFVSENPRHSDEDKKDAVKEEDKEKQEKGKRKS